MYSISYLIVHLFLIIDITKKEKASHIVSKSVDFNFLHLRFKKTIFL